jgi:hypothetical protein
VIGDRDTVAEERAELLALREKSALRRKALGETVGALAEKITTADPASWARQAASRAARRAARTARRKARRAYESHRLPVMAAAAGAGVLVAAVATGAALRSWPARPALARARRRRRRRRF